MNRMAIHHYQPQQTQVDPQQDTTRVFSQLMRQQEQDREQNISSIFEIDNEPIVDQLANYLRGKHLVENEWRFIDEENPSSHRIMNEKGIVNVVTLLRPHVNKLVILSELMLEEIYVICRDVRFALIRLFAEHYEEFDINPTKANMSVLLTTLDNAIFATVKRAFRGGERKHRETLLKIHEQSVLKETDKQGGGFNPFKALMRRGDKQ